MENSRLPTAKEFLRDNAPCSTEGFMIEFAKMHVKAALEEADGEVPLFFSKDVLSCYPPEKIK